MGDKIHPILTVQDVFNLSSGRCLVVPDFPVSDNVPAPIQLSAVLIKENGGSVKCELVLELTHFNIPADQDVSKRWRLVPSLRNIAIGDVVVGDVLCIYDTEIAEALRASLK